MLSKSAQFLLFFSIGGMLCSFSVNHEKTGNRVNALDNAVWEHSQWISACDAPVVTERIDGNSRAADGASWFLTEITNPREVKSAVWMTTGLGIYHIFINGVPVGDDALKPGFTHWQKTKRSFTYDITDAFAKGGGEKNRLAAQVTPGWWADKINTPGGNDGMRGHKTAFRGVLEVTYADGEKKYFGTNTSDWTAGIAGPVKHAAIFDGEEYDAREPFPSAGTILIKPEVNAEFNGAILPSKGAEVCYRYDLALAPVNTYIWKGFSDSDSTHFGTVKVVSRYEAGRKIKLHKGETLVVDFGQNAAAVPAFDFKSTEGVTLTCEPGELLNDGNGAKQRGMDGPEGSVHRENLRALNLGINVKYTFADNRETSYMPECTFFGYRYISLTADGDVTFSDIKSIPVTSIARSHETGKLETGNEDINRLIKNTYWGMLSNYLSIPTDCPQRDERLGWMADTQVFAETGSFFANTDRFFHKWLQDVRDTQLPSGSYGSVSPESQYGTAGASRLGWADAGIIVPWVVWKQFGDTAIINESWDSMERFMSHISETEYDHNRLISENENFQYGDWLSYEPFESYSEAVYGYNDDGTRYVLPEALTYWNYLSACYWLSDAAMMEDMARATGRSVSPYVVAQQKARKRIADLFLDGDGNFRLPVLNTMQTPSLFALRNGLVQGDAREKVIRRLRDNFEKHGNRLQTGFLGTSILMPTLTDNGMADIAYDLLLQHKNPSWLYSVDNGATTIWERWNSYMKDSGMGPSGMNSFNHYAYGVVCEWMWKTMAGISADTAAPGFRNIIMKPVPDRRIGFVNAEYESVAGTIKSSWKYDGDKWIWDFSIPEGCTADVTFPDGSASQRFPSGNYHKELFLNEPKQDK